MITFLPLDCYRVLEILVGIWQSFILIGLQRENAAQNTSIVISGSLGVTVIDVKWTVSFKIHNLWPQKQHLTLDPSVLCNRNERGVQHLQAGLISPEKRTFS